MLMWAKRLYLIAMCHVRLTRHSVYSCSHRSSQFQFLLPLIVIGLLPSHVDSFYFEAFYCVYYYILYMHIYILLVILCTCTYMHMSCVHKSIILPFYDTVVTILLAHKFPCLTQVQVCGRNTIHTICTCECDV